MPGPLRLAAALQEVGGSAPAGGTVRTIARVFLGILIVVLVSYVLLEQIGTWRRRRSGRD